jgi:hypothetical protein
VAHQLQLGRFHLARIAPDEIAGGVAGAGLIAGDAGLLDLLGRAARDLDTGPYLAQPLPPAAGDLLEDDRICGQ